MLVCYKGDCAIDNGFNPTSVRLAGVSGIGFIPYTHKRLTSHLIPFEKIDDNGVNIQTRIHTIFLKLFVECSSMRWERLGRVTTNSYSDLSN